MKVYKVNFIFNLLLLLCSVLLFTNTAIAQSNNTNSHLNSPSLDHIFKNYEGEPNKFVPKLQKHKIPKLTNSKDEKNTKGNNLDFEAFLEVREFAKSGIIMRSLPNKNGVPLYSLKASDMIKVRFTLHDYMRQQQAEKKNLGFWRQVKTKGTIDTRNFYFFSHWKEMQTLNPYEKVSLDILVPQNQVSVPVFNKPGHSSWKECSQIYNLCNAFIDTYSNVELMDAKIFEVDTKYSDQKNWELFYKVKFSYLKSDSRSSTGTGWIPAKYAKRKIKPLSLAIYNLSRDRGPAGSIDNNGGKKFFVFDKNKKNPYISESRWLSSTSATQLKYKTGIFDKNFAIDAIVGFNYTTLTQDFFDTEQDALEQYGINVGLGISAPLYLDVDLEGSFVVSTPITSSNEKKSTFMYLDQMFNITIPRRWLNAPIRWGIGGYYYLMTNNSDEYGFSSLVGFHTRLKYDARSWHLFLKFSPIGVDLAGDFKDREFTAGAGWKMKPEKGYNSPHVNIEIADVYYRPEDENNTPQTIEIQKFNINYIHPF